MDKHKHCYKSNETLLLSLVCQPTLGVGEGPGEARLVLVLPHVLFLLPVGGVLDLSPCPAPVRFFAAVDSSPDGMDLLRAAL